MSTTDQSKPTNESVQFVQSNESVSKSNESVSKSKKSSHRKLIRNCQLNVASTLQSLRNQVAPNMQMKMLAQNAIADYINSISEKIVEHIWKVKRHYSGRSSKHKVIRKITNVKLIQDAISVLVPQELGKHMISHGTKAVVRYQEYKPPSNTMENGTQNATRVSSNEKAGLFLPVCKVRKFLESFSESFKPLAGVFLTGALEFLATELIRAGSEVTSAKERVQITDTDVYRGVFGDLPSQKLASRNGQEQPYFCEGDDDLKTLAESFNWGVLRRSLGHVYTHKVSDPSKKESSEPVSNSVSNSESSNHSKKRKRGNKKEEKEKETEAENDLNPENKHQKTINQIETNQQTNQTETLVSA